MNEYHVTCLHCGKSWKTTADSADALIRQYSRMTTCFAGAHPLQNGTLSQNVYFTSNPFSLGTKPNDAERELFKSLKETSLSMFLVEKDVPLLTALVAQRALIKELIERCDFDEKAQ